MTTSEVCMNGVRYYRFKIGDKKWNEQVAASKFAKFDGFGKAGKGHHLLAGSWQRSRLSQYQDS